MELQQLEVLVDELIKEAPNEDFVKDYMKEAGLDYQKDPVSRINYVLKLMSFSESEHNEPGAQQSFKK